MANQEMAKAPAQAAEQVAEKGLLDQIVEDGRVGTDVATRERGKSLVKEFISQVLEGEVTVSKDVEAMINARVAQIDHLLSIQLNEILHHPQFQKLEGSWRGLKYLISQSETSAMLKIRVMNVSKKELLRDLQRAPEFDQSALFKKIYEEEFGVFGGDPFAAMIGDYEFSKQPGGPGTPGKGLSGCWGGARAIPDGCFITTTEYGEFYAIGSAAGHRKDF